MPGIRLHAGLHFSFAGREYLIQTRLPNRELQIKDLHTNLLEPLRDETFLDHLFNGRIEILYSGFDTTEPKRIPPNLYGDDFSQLPEAQRGEARRRYAYVTEVKAHGLTTLTKNTLEPVIKVIGAELKDTLLPSWLTVYRWFKAYVSTGESILALVPSERARGNRSRKMPAEVIGIINQVIAERYLSRERPTVPSIHDTVVARIAHDNRFRDQADQLPIPHLRSIYKIVTKLDSYEKTKGRYGSRLADQEFRAHQRPSAPTRPLERVEVDHTKLDLFVIDPEKGLPIGRPWLTTAIDVYSRVVTGLYISFNPPSYLSVMNCLRHAILPKQYVRTQYPQIKHEWTVYGIPEMIVVDNGKEFHSTHFEDACLQLGVAIQYAPVQLAWYKGSIERYFGTLNQRLLHEQAGTTFSNIVEKSEYDAELNAIISFATLLEIVHVWVIDIYHQGKHRGLRDIPARVWEAAITEYPPALPHKRETLEILLGQLAHRAISKSGVELHGLLYNHEELILLRRHLKKGERATIKYDPNDLSLVHVLDGKNHRYVPVPAVNQEYTKGLSLWQHDIIKRYAQQQVDGYVNIVDLALAKQSIQEIVDRDWQLIKRTGRRQRMARWNKHDQQVVKESAETLSIKDASSPSFEAAQSLVTVTAADSCWAGVSDLGTAFNEAHGSSDRVNLNSQPLSFDKVNDLAPSKTGNRQAAKKRTGSLSPRRRRKDAREVSDKSDSLKSTDAPAESEDDFDLDMTGWSADYNLPK